MYMVRAKLFCLSDQNQWKERGTGTLKLNVRKSDGERARLVMRKEAVFTVLLNVTLFHGMSVFIAQDPRYIRLSVIEDGATVHYNLRVNIHFRSAFWRSTDQESLGRECQDWERALRCDRGLYSDSSYMIHPTSLLVIVQKLVHHLVVVSVYVLVVDLRTLHWC